LRELASLQTNVLSGHSALIEANFRLRQQYHFPGKEKAAVPVKARKCPLALSGLQKMGPGRPNRHALSRPMRVARCPATGRIVESILPFSSCGV
jgi:hypothetical protein